MILGMQNPTQTLEYKLQREATQHKTAGRLKQAIECLREANNLMDSSNISYDINSYLRLPKYLILDGQREAAYLELRKYETREWFIAHRAELYSYLGKLLLEDGDTYEAAFYLSAGFIMTAVNIQDNYRFALENKIRDEARKFKDRLYVHKEKIGKLLKGLPPKIITFVASYSLDNFDEPAFRNELNNLITANRPEKKSGVRISDR